MELNLELRCWFKVWVSFIVEVVLVDGFDSGLEHLDEVVGPVAELGDQGIIEGYKVLHVHAQKVLASLCIALELFSVDIGASNLALPDEMHELVFNLSHFIVIVALLMVLSSVDQLLVCVIYS